MASKTCYPNTLSQSDGSGYKIYREFNNLNNVKNNNDTYAKTGQIASKVGTHRRPSTISASNFKFNIPDGSKITKITVEYANDYEGNIGIRGPSVDLLNVSASAKTGKALTTTMTKTTLSWTGNFNVSKVNSSSFGVKINYPENSRYDVGYVKVKYIRIIVTYSEPNFTLTSSKVSGEYTGDEFLVKVTCKNKGGTTGGTNVKMTLPSGVSFVRMESGDGNVSGTTWNTKIGSKTSVSATFRFLVSTDGNHTITFKETSTNHTNSITLVSVVKPANIDSETEIEEEPQPQTLEYTVEHKELHMVKNQPYELKIQLRNNVNDIENRISQTLSEYGAIISFYARTISTFFEFHVGETELTPTTPEGDIRIPNGLFDENNSVTLILTPNRYFKMLCDYDAEHQFYRSGNYVQDLTYTSEDRNNNIPSFYWFDLYVAPEESDLSTPMLSILRLSDEELNRLGDGFTYDVESYLKVESTYYHNWYKNFRIGLFNNEIENVSDYDNLSAETIFSNTENWSDTVSTLGSFEKLSCEFAYDEDYPVYVLLVGDYVEGEADNSSVYFTSPTIKQSDDVKSDNQCIFPEPINNIVGDDLSSLKLSSFTSSNGVVLYNFDLENIETDKYTSIIGMQVNITADITEDTSILVKLKDKNKAPGERSIVITNTDAENRIISLGGLYDLWGFDIEDIVNLDQWEVEIIFNNYWLNPVESMITIEDVEFVIYTQNIEDNRIICYLNGKDTRHYGMFIEEVKIPTGLNSDVKYFDINGVDRKDAYLQNIDKKEISIKFSVNGCSIEETTAFLKMIGKLFSNERDDFNNPIPNMLEFNHYPSEYWNVILEKAIDATTEIANYEGTIKLVVPDGTSFSKEKKITNVVGNNTSIAKIKPEIVLTPTLPIAKTLKITELNSKQNLVINYDDFKENDILILDCEEKTLFLKRFDDNENDYVDSDISDAIDWKSDFFTLFGDYHFDSENCLVQTVSFRERW